MSEMTSAVISYRAAREPKPARNVKSPPMRPADRALDPHEAPPADHDEVDACGVASFPASDPPGWWSGR
jgi:hypothetical protein